MGAISALASARSRAVVVVCALVAAGAVVIAQHAPAAHADTVPPTGTPATVSADALPTVQQNGVVWKQVTVGNIVYATGSFSQTWPAGSTNTTANDTPRANLLAFDITTGNLITSFNHTLNAQGLTITASPDGSRVYVGGDFTTVDGQARGHIAAFDTANGALDPNFKPNVGAEVRAITANNSTVYVGGNFLSANGVARKRLAAFAASNGAMSSWAPTADDNIVNAILLTPDQSEVVIGGDFITLNGINSYGLGAVTTAGGTSVPYAVNQYVQDYTPLNAGSGQGAGILALATDGTQIYGSGYSFYEGNFEGTFAVSPDTGAVNFINDCHGDTYDVLPVGQVLYTVSHQHTCQWIGSFPNTAPNWTLHHTLAFTTYPTGTDTGPDDYGWNYAGFPDTTLLNWSPSLAIGSFTGQYQAAWSVTGNSNYIAEGGEFPSVNGVAQQGLVRFALTSKAPNKVGPLFSNSLTPSVVSLSSGTARVGWGATYDYDNALLTYKVYRDNNTTTPIYTTTATSNFWQLPTMGFTDTGLTPGSTHKYLVKAYDPFNNTTNGFSTSVTITSTTPSQYSQDVIGDGASDFWRLGETSGTTGYDWAGFSDLTEGSTVGHGATGAVTGDSDGASTFDGSSTGAASTTTAIPGPNTFTIEAFFKTTSTSGGKIVGFGDTQEGNLSSNYDRQIYMDNAGHITFGVYNNGTYTISTGNTYNDGQWHQVQATMSSAGMVLYIDGRKVGVNQSTTVGQVYNGYWRVGGDNLGGWPSQPSSNYFAGTIDDVAIYPTAVTLAQVQKHFTDSGGTLNIPTAPTDTYGKAVYNDQPDLYWRLDEAVGPTANDTTPNGDPGNYQGGISYHAPSTVTGPTGTGVTLDGSTGQIVASQQVNDPTVYSEELWFNTTTQSGGKLIGFGNASSGQSNNYDRHVYMLNTGQLEFGTYTGALNTIVSPASYNDGKWHHLVATQGPDGMILYVDGQVTGTNPQTAAQAYGGYWRVGGDQTWGGASSNYFAGTIDEVAVYSYELTPAQVKAHYHASNAAVNSPPVASFTKSCAGLTCSFNGSGSSDSDGTVVGYSWNFGDGTTATGPTASHTYASGALYAVTLTVTDDQGATGQAAANVNVQAPPADAYGQSVVAANPAIYWRLNEASGPTAADASVNGVTGVYSGGVTYQTPSTVAPGTGVTLDGSTGLVSSSQSFTAPNVYTESGWFNTTSTSGGMLMGFGDQQTGLSGNHDRDTWMLNDGQISFGVWNGEVDSITSPNSYNDGNWHQVVSTQGPDGMSLYIDGALVASNAITTAQPNYTGYWKVGSDTVWGGASSNYFGGSVDEVAIYTSELAAATVSAQYQAAGSKTNQPPVATIATPSCTDLACSFDGSGSSDPDGTIASYAWTFGDGATATTAKPTHTYTAAGSYSVTLIVTDNQGATSTAATTVNVSGPVAAAFATPSCTDLVCSVNGSGSTDPGGSITSYAWTFGDGGTATGATASHTYASAATYTITLTVTDNQGVTSSTQRSVTVSGPVVASFATPSCTNLVCSVDGSGSTDPGGSITSYAWTFGDGGTATGATASHTYASAATYTITLTVTDNQGVTSSTNQSVTVSKTNQPPVATIATPSCTDLACSFDGSGSSDPDGTIASYAWTFGDGATATTAKPTHTYTAAGSYPVTLIVTDNQGATSTAATTVNVSGPVAAAIATPSCTNLVCSVNGSGSTDPGGSITSYAWTFGDGGTATGATASHTYASAATYTITLTVTDNQGVTSTATVTVAPTTGGTTTPYATDSFNRTVASGFGTADTGGPWTVQGTTSVSGGTGSLTMSKAGATSFAYLGSISKTDTDTTVTVTSDKAGTSNGILMAVVGRRVSSTVDYRARLHVLSNNTVGIALLSENAGVETTLKGETILAGTYVPGTKYNVELQVTGTNPTTLRLKVWAAGTTKPTAWQLTTTDSTPALQVAGSVGLSTYLAGAATNAPVTMQVSNFATGPTVANVPPTASIATPSCTDLACSVNGSGSTDPDGTITSYAWTFGDGATATGATASHTYTAAGSYTITLTVTDNSGATNSTQQPVTVSGPVTAAFATPSCTNLACSVDGSTSTDPGGSITSYAWTFGDGGTATGATASHTYASAGQYTITLTVTDNQGVTSSTHQTVTVSAVVNGNQPPVAVFTPTCTNLGCSFDGSASKDPDGTIAAYAWSFGDGTTGTGVTASHTYAAAGDFTVGLTVTDNSNAATTTSQVVSPRPAANPSTTPYATDLFNRTVASGFGTADTGGVWTVQGTASVAAGTASLAMTKAGATSLAYLGSISKTDTNTTVTISTDKVATSNGVSMAVVGRRVSATVDYRARVRLLSNNTVGIALLSENAGVETTLKGETILTGVTYSAGMQLNVRLQVTGTSPTTLRLKVWPTGTTEPTAWQLTTTDATAALQVAGSVGLSTYLSGGSTNAPVTMLVSNFATGPTVAPPTAVFTANCSHLSCSVDGSTSTDPSGTITSYQWEWADGTLTTGATSTHTFATPGTYRITLTVTDPSGWTAIQTQTVTVAA